MISISSVQRIAEELMAKAAIEIPDDYLAGLRKCADTEKGDPALNNKLEDICRKSAELVRDELKQVRISDLMGKGGDTKRKKAGS